MWAVGNLRKLIVTLADKFFNHPLTLVNLVVVIAMFIILILSIFGGLSHRWSNACLTMLRVMVQMAWSSLQPKATTYTTCPKCFVLYEPEVKGDILMLSCCDYKPTACSQPCCTRLTMQYVKVTEGWQEH
jgi:hypothetical protein